MFREGGGGGNVYQRSQCLAEEVMFGGGDVLAEEACLAEGAKRHSPAMQT